MEVAGEGRVAWVLVQAKRTQTAAVGAHPDVIMAVNKHGNDGVRGKGARIERVVSKDKKFTRGRVIAQKACIVSG